MIASETNETRIRALSQAGEEGGGREGGEGKDRAGERRIVGSSFLRMMKWPSCYP